ncbi:MAG: hypothetical protein ACJ79H_15640 [Myxococcales bacterium]
MPDPLILYSTNTWLAYTIANRYYGEEHYVWCTPAFDPRQSAAVDVATPPTSSPSEIYHSLAAEVRRGDRHSAKIKENRTGILNGAGIKQATGIITKRQLAEISAIVRAAETRDFRPLLFLIPFVTAKQLTTKVPVGKRAHPLSVEYVIERLPRRLFDAIYLERDP